MNKIPQTTEFRDSLVSQQPFIVIRKSNVDTTFDQQSIPFQDKLKLTTFFSGHLLKTKSIQPQTYQRYPTDWNLFIIILWVSIVAWVRYFYGKRFQHLLLAPFLKRFQKQLLREGDLFSERLALAMGFSYFIGIALLIYQIPLLLFNGMIYPTFTGFSFYILLLFLLFLYWFCKIIMMLILGAVFKTKTTTHEYLINILIINTIASLVMLPSLILIIYLQSVLIIYITLAIIALLWLFRFIKGFLTGLSLTKFSYIFLFVYLCSLEILPLIVMIKLSIIFYSSKVLIK